MGWISLTNKRIITIVFLITIIVLSVLGCTDQTPTAPDESSDNNIDISPAAIRHLTNACIEPGVQFDVQITASDYGSAARITETLCAGWTYVNSSLVADGQVDQSDDNNEVTFTLFGETNFNYTVQAPSTAGVCCDFNGTITDFNKNVQSVKGDSQVCIC
jgi:hypothetical protein